MYESRQGPLPKDVPLKSKLVMSTTKATLMSKEVTDMKLKTRQDDPFLKHKTAFKMNKFKEVKGVVSTNRKPFIHHTNENKPQQPHQGGDGQHDIHESQRLPPINQ